jgi:L-ascorbate metabolism protein UlaG (beta-lactamase superfamily)
MSIHLQWYGHASFRIEGDGKVVYIDPWKLENPVKDGDIILVSHSHYDHFSKEDIENVAGVDANLAGPADVIRQLAYGQVIEPQSTITLDNVSITGVAAYNPQKQFHPRENHWVGFLVELGGKRIYYAGDTDITQEMLALHNIDVALMPVGGTYTLDAEEAAKAVNQIQAKQAVPYHWGDIVGSLQDAERFAEITNYPVSVIQPGDSIEL